MNSETEIRNKNRFSIPYNGEVPDIFQKKIDGYREYIHDIYLSLPGIPDFFSKSIDRHKPNYYDRGIQVIEKLNENGYKVVATVNGNYTELSYQERIDLAGKAVKSIRDYNIYGVVVSNFDIACYIHQNCPDVKINTSCNVVQYDINSLYKYREYCDVDLVNPTRDAGRNINLLKKLKEHGYKIKVLLNEPCDITCPNLVSFCKRSQSSDYPCVNFRYENSPIRNCIVLPRWLDILDEYVEIYKITGKYYPTDYLFKIFDLYLSRSDDCYLNNFLPGLRLSIPVRDIPDDVLHCDKDCSNCTICEDFHKKFLKR